MLLFLLFVIPLSLSPLFFLLIMLLLRKKNFNEKGERISNWRKLTPELLSSQVQYHNESVYKAFEFYIKVTLAIFGAIGIASVSVSENYNPKNVVLIIEYLGYITLGITFLFGFIYISHQKAKIERWDRRFRWFEPLLWNECWLFSITITIALVVNFLIIPKLIGNL
jgi:hypothetical protein